MKGFTLLEIVVALALVTGLAVMVLPALSRSVKRAQVAECASKLRVIGHGVTEYAMDHHGEFPRSWHSAGANGEPGWAVSIAPYLGVSNDRINLNWPEVFDQKFRAPGHAETNPYVFSYALNVHFELSPDGDDYAGAPATWRRVVQIPSPSKTILVARSRPVLFGDHLMCHQWSGTASAMRALNQESPEDRTNILFVDGHVENLAAAQTLDPGRGINRWNPSLAR